MYQLCNLINHTSVQPNPSNNAYTCLAATNFSLLTLSVEFQTLGSTIAVNFIHLLHATSPQAPATCEDRLYLNAVELLTLSLLGMAFVMLLKREIVSPLLPEVLLAIFNTSHFIFSEKQKAQLL